MKILVTGANGFAGKNLVANLMNFKEGKNRTRDLFIEEVFACDLDTDAAHFDRYCRDADFVFHFAGVNRPEDVSEFRKGNYDAAAALLAALKKHGNKAPVMYASSIQAALDGQYADSAYGKSKLAGEELLFQYAEETGVLVLVYRFPNLFGKWGRPNYNSAVATFCHAVANGLAYTVNNRETQIELLYIDDLIEEMYDALEGKEHRCHYDGRRPVEQAQGKYCYVPKTYQVSLGMITDLLELFQDGAENLFVPQMPEDSFEAKLYSTYVSYLPKHKIAYGLPVWEDERGIFAELIKTGACGQVSVNIIRPQKIKGQHWHNSKWEIFMVVSGHGRIQQRKIGLDENGKPYPVIEMDVCGEQMKAVRMLPGYTHNIINLSSMQDLVTVMWANERFDPKRPDTFFETVKGEGVV